MSYIIPIQYAFMLFPMAAFLFTLPFLLYQYRKYGYINKIRAVVLYALLLYLMNAYFLVILPLPDTQQTCTPESMIHDPYQSTPFHFIEDIANETQVNLSKPGTYISLLGERAFQQVAFNVLMLVPFGMILRYYFQRSWVRTIFTSLLLSLFFEITQVTGLYGIYECPYRLFDVDDLIANTSGGLLGYIIAPLLTRFLPKTEELDEGIVLDELPIALTRRLLALGVDYLLLLLPIGFIVMVSEPIYALLPILAYFIFVPWITNGYTFGKWLLRIRLIGQGERIELAELVHRYGLLYAGWGGMNMLLLSGVVKEFPIIITQLIMFAVFLVDVVFVLHIISRLYRKDKRLLHDKWSHTRQRVR
ncbi:VanZ family protein [Marinicrinis lubricantis]|uniref:VanZ family protein n=1 Tax=Marinicrinis lubricantis TaxID=2086470 RepID=A0ABW1ISE1_9BACL